MSLDAYLMPLLALMVGFGSLFTDPSSKYRKLLVPFLVLSLIASFGLTVWRNYDSWNIAEIKDTQQKEEISWNSFEIFSEDSL